MRQFIHRGNLFVVLRAAGIEVNGDGSAEYAEIDRDYHGNIRFRDFHKYLLSKEKPDDGK